MNTHAPGTGEWRLAVTTIMHCPMSSVCSKYCDDLTPTADSRASRSAPIGGRSRSGGCVAFIDGTYSTHRMTLCLPAFGGDKLRRYLDGP